MWAGSWPGSFWVLSSTAFLGDEVILVRDRAAGKLLFASMYSTTWLFVSFLLLPVLMLRDPLNGWGPTACISVGAIGSVLLNSMERRVLVRKLTHDPAVFTLWLTLDGRRVEAARRGLAWAKEVGKVTEDQAHAIVKLTGLAAKRRSVIRFSTSYRLILDACLLVLGSFAGYFLFP